MSEIMIKPTKVKAYASDIRDLKTRMDEAISSSESIVNALPSVWEDANHEEWDAEFRGMTKALREFSETLPELARAADTHADGIIAAGK